MDTSGGIWVGSMDGIVTRLVRENTASGASLVIDKRCRADASSDPLTGPFSLGYGVRALAVLEDTLVVGTHSRLMVFDATDPDEPLVSVDLPFSEQRPGHLQIVEGLFPEASSCHVAYLSYMGELVIRDLDTLAPVAHLSDPDCTDFEFGPSVVDGMSRPLYLATRDSLVEVVIDESLDYGSAGSAPVPTTVKVLAAGEYTRLIRDLVWQGNRLSVLAEDDGHGSVLQFEPLSHTPRLESVHTAVSPPMPFGNSPRPDTFFGSEIAAVPGTSDMVVMHKGHLFLATPTSPAMDELSGLFPGATIDPLTYNSVTTSHFPAAFHAIAMQIGDVAPQDGVLDVILSTENGQVAYFPLPELRSPTGLDAI